MVRAFYSVRVGCELEFMGSAPLRRGMNSLVAIGTHCTLPKVVVEGKILFSAGDCLQRKGWSFKLHPFLFAIIPHYGEGAYGSSSRRSDSLPMATSMSPSSSVLSAGGTNSYSLSPFFFAATTITPKLVSPRSMRLFPTQL